MIPQIVLILLRMKKACENEVMCSIVRLKKTQHVMTDN